VHTGLIAPSLICSSQD